MNLTTFFLSNYFSVTQSNLIITKYQLMSNSLLSLNIVLFYHSYFILQIFFFKLHFWVSALIIIIVLQILYMNPSLILLVIYIAISFQFPVIYGIPVSQFKIKDVYCVSDNRNNNISRFSLVSVIYIYILFDHYWPQ